MVERTVVGVVAYTMSVKGEEHIDSRDGWFIPRCSSFSGPGLGVAYFGGEGGGKQA